jgi:O-antigen biosynthesis protein
MKFTGEQFVPGNTGNRLLEEHYERYRFAMSFAENKNVLDIACGTGYGTNMLSKKANTAVGVDVSKDSIDFAKKNYTGTNLKYIAASVEEPLFPKDSFDVICSFETIEHLQDELRRKYLANLKNWLKQNGTLILSTPNKMITSPFTEKPLNTYHVLEFTKIALLNELAPYFAITEILGQRPIRKILTNFIIRKGIHAFQKIITKDFGIYSTLSSPIVTAYNDKGYEPRVFIVICKNFRNSNTFERIK